MDLVLVQCAQKPVKSHQTLRAFWQHSGVSAPVKNETNLTLFGMCAHGIFWYFKAKLLFRATPGRTCFTFYLRSKEFVLVPAHHFSSRSVGGFH